MLQQINSSLAALTLQPSPLGGRAGGACLAPEGRKWKSRETTNLETSSETTARGQALRKPLLLPTSILQA